jgi:hypothetical protein
VHVQPNVRFDHALLQEIQHLGFSMSQDPFLLQPPCATITILDIKTGRTIEISLRTNLDLSLEGNSNEVCEDYYEST